jgi:hypothetical protein
MTTTRHRPSALGFLGRSLALCGAHRTAPSAGRKNTPAFEREPGSRDRSNQAIADDVHLAVSSAAEVIRALVRRLTQGVVVALRRPLIQYLSRMASKIEG